LFALLESRESKQSFQSRWGGEKNEQDPEQMVPGNDGKTCIDGLPYQCYLGHASGSQTNKGSQMSCQRLNKKLRPAQHKSRQREVNNDHMLNLPMVLDDEKFIMKLK
jgi:hypothetical protein